VNPTGPRPLFSEPYTVLAPHYDAMSGREGFRLYAPRYEELLRRSGLAPGDALDAACGTGLWARRLAKLGWSVVGVDRSPEMLARARRRCRGLAVTLRAVDILEIDSAAEFDLVTCTYDSLNYLACERDLATALGRFAAALRPGGVAIFDTNTTIALRDRWATRTVVKRASRAVALWQGGWDARRRRNGLVIECFVQREGAEELWERHVEIHTERPLDPGPVGQAALGAGFGRVEAYDIESLEPAGARTAKAVFVAWRSEAPGRG